jgi:enoyl-CoA hydratase
MTSDDYTTLQVERWGDVLRVTIAHPTSPLNAVDAALHHDLTMLFAGLKREAAARCVLLTGRGRAFSAGGDFAWFPTLREPGQMEALRRDAKQLIWDQQVAGSTPARPIQELRHLRRSLLAT